MIDLRPRLVAADRLQAVAEYDIHHPGLGARLDDLCRRTSEWMGMVVAVTAVLDSAMVVLGSAGPDAPEAGSGMPAEWSFCQVVVAERRPYVVPDAAIDPAHRDTPTAHKGVRAYAGLPLLLAGGHALGACCVLGREPHEFSNAELAALRTTADAALAMIEGYPNVGR